MSVLTDCYLLQDDLNNIMKWTTENKLKVNVGKYISMSFTRNKDPVNFNYKLGSTILKSVHEHKDLGVLFDTQLTFTLHMQKIVAQSNKTLGFVIRNTKPFKNTSTCMLSYNTLVGPKLEYASVVWSPRCKKHISMLEKTQKKFLKYLHFKRTGIYPQLTPYQELLVNFKVDSLETRRKVDAMKFLFKIINNFIDNFQLLYSLNFHVPRLNSRNSVTFTNKRTRTSAHENSPLNRICNIYNSAVRTNSTLDFSSPLTTFLTEFRSTF